MRFCDCCCCCSTTHPARPLGQRLVVLMLIEHAVWLSPLLLYYYRQMAEGRRVCVECGAIKWMGYSFVFPFFKRKELPLFNMGAGRMESCLTTILIHLYACNRIGHWPPTPSFAPFTLNARKISTTPLELRWRMVGFREVKFINYANIPKFTKWGGMDRWIDKLRTLK